MKRLFDFITALLGLVLLFPFFLVIGILIKINDKGPIIFKQKRAGRHGKLFTICKFRTMSINNGGITISVKGEKRITSFGACLRKYKLDELPELWNVFIGEMSFVGPRPDMPEYAAKLIGEEKLIMELRPGITCPATLKYSNEEELLAYIQDPQKYNDEIIWPDKVKINLAYYYNRSFFGDIYLIFRTILVGHKKTQLVIDSPLLTENSDNIKHTFPILIKEYITEQNEQ
jgi:lipopolysaccharide/colanic/teichoic acid biosynthesis glycosyltransferase